MIYIAKKLIDRNEKCYGYFFLRVLGLESDNLWIKYRE